MALKNSIAQLIKDEWNKHEQMRQMTIWDALPSNNQKTGSCVSPSEPTHERSAEPTHEPTQWVQEYTVTKGDNKHKYYRYCYLPEPGNIRSAVRVHLPGGNTLSTKALALKNKVEDAIANGLSPAHIRQLIRRHTSRAN